MSNVYLNTAAAYLRCSTDMQDGSIVQQKREISIWAEKNRLRIINWYEDEGKSGTSFLKRPGFLRLKGDIENGSSFKYVLVYDESRWGRAKDPRENSYWKIHYKMNGVQVKIINSNSNNGDDVGSYVVEVVESAEASEYSKKLARATLRGQKTNALAGFSCGGSAPYGYKRVALNKVSNEFVRVLHSGIRAYPDEKVIFDIGDPHEVETVKRIFELKIQGLGYKRIATVLNNEKVPCPRRGRWKNKDQKWSANTLYTIITNPVYTGTRVFNRHPQSHLSGVTKEKWFSDPKDWVVKKNAHPLIVSEEIFNQVNQCRKPYTRTNRFFYESPYLLSGILKCAKCNFNFQGQTRKLKSKKTNEDYTISYYEDSGYINKGNAVCKSYLLRKEELEGFIIKQIKNFITDKNFLKNLFCLMEKKLLNNTEVDSLLTNFKQQLDNNKKVLQSLLELVRNGVSLQEVQDEIYRINKENEYLQRNYDEIKNKKTDKNDIRKVIEDIRVLIDNFESTFNKAPLHIQKNIIRQFVSEIVVNPSTNVIHCNFRKVPWVENSLSKKNIYGIEEISSDIKNKIKASRKTA
ncbi:recombinase family protein [Candidatus Bathyarchaeota archaeon]|nr:recombinase family protein [Candidatus Bathyarchaeota archaeon]